jgi:hypothetical protein
MEFLLLRSTWNPGKRTTVGTEISFASFIRSRRRLFFEEMASVLSEYFLLEIRDSVLMSTMCVWRPVPGFELPTIWSRTSGPENRLIP